MMQLIVFPGGDVIQEKFGITSNVGDYVFLLLTAACIILAIAVTVYPTRMRNIAGAMVTSSGMNILMREGNFFKQSIVWMTFIFYAIVATLFYYQVAIFFKRGDISVFDTGILYFTATAVVFLPLVKWLLAFFLGRLMRTKNSMRQIIITSNLYNFSCGLILLPAVAIISYSNYSGAVIYVACGLILINYLFCLGRFLFIGFSDNKLSNIYFIIYLCTFKILPPATIAIMGCRML